MKKILIVLLIGAIALINNKPINALEANNEFIYDLENDTSKIFEYYDENELITIKIEKRPTTNRNINDGRYKISTSRQGSWNASFQVSIKNYKMVTAGNSQATAIVGSFVSKNLKIDNSYTTTYYLKRKVGIIISNIYLRAQIENKNLKVIVK